MAQESPNPFVLPGFGQQGEAAQNPLFAGLDMMRQAWQNLAGAGRMDAPAMPPMSLEDLDRRIRELQTVQNWLQLNATMLANTIQGMEIQRSTLKTLQSFAGAVVPDAAGAAAAAGSADGASQGYAQAAGDWWNLVQQQFEQLREATTASLSSMAEATDAARATAASGKSAGEQGPSTGARAPAARKTPPKKAPTTGKTSAAAKPARAASKPARKPRAS
ncbi:MAG: transcriptional regulator [Castellaniella sp.]|nr:transcriptional regulator [Castellaniella sp.]